MISFSQPVSTVQSLKKCCIVCLMMVFSFEELRQVAREFAKAMYNLS